MTVLSRGAPRRGTGLSDLNVIRDGAVLVRDGRIVEVGTSRRVENLAVARGAIEVNVAGRVVMPGLVDAHTHLAFPPPGIRTADQESTIRAVRAVTGQRLEFYARNLLDSMARHGTTTVEIKTGCCGDESAEAKLARVIQSLRGNPLDLVPSYLYRWPLPPGAPEAAQFENAAIAMLEKLRRRRAIEFADLMWNAHPELLPSFERYLMTAHSLGVPSRLHAEGPFPDHAIALAARHGVTAVDHLEDASEAQAQQVAAAGMAVTLLPAPGFQETRRTPPARALLDAGVVVALGSDFNAHHTGMLSMQTAIALACRRLGMTIEEAICAATINAAWTLGCAHDTGSLEPKKLADLLILNAEDYRDLPAAMGTNLVHQTMKRGKFIYKEGDVAKA